MARGADACCPNDVEPVALVADGRLPVWRPIRTRTSALSGHVLGERALSCHGTCDGVRARGNE